MQQENNIFESSSLSEMSKSNILETTRWTKFIAILGFVVIGLMVIGLIALTAFSSAMMSSMSSSFGAGGGVFMTIIWAIMVAVYWYPTLMLYKFSKSMKEGLTYNNQAMIDDGFRYQKNMWKFTGILMIVIISFYVLAILAAIVGISR